MDPLLHYLRLQVRPPFVDAREAARRRETLAEHEREIRSRRTQRRRERVRRSIALARARRWRLGSELIGRAG